MSYWVFTPDAEVHRPSLNVLKRYGTSQQTYAYGLADHLNWARVNGKTPETVTLQDLQRYMNGVTDQADGVYGIAFRTVNRSPSKTHPILVPPTLRTHTYHAFATNRGRLAANVPNASSGGS
jgi:hypothetical protein